MNARSFEALLLSGLSAILLAGNGRIAYADCDESARAECGDVDGSGDVLAKDALMVLRKSVGLSDALTCCVTTTSTTQGQGDECHSDDDCEGFPPGREHCCEFACSECDTKAHCPDGSFCGSNCSCQPYAHQ